MDLGQNLRWLSAANHEDYIDYSSSGKSRSAMELYMLGTTQMIISFFGMMFASMSFGFSLLIKDSTKKKAVR